MVGFAAVAFALLAAFLFLRYAMKADLIAQEVFTVQVGCLRIEMRVVSKWNGLMELRNAANEVLIVSAPEQHPMADTFSTLFGDVFRTAEQTKSAGATVVMGSPAIIERFRLASSDIAQGK